MRKQDVLDLLQQLPDEIPAEQLIHELYLLAEAEANANHRPNYLVDEELVEMGEDWYE